MTEKNLILTVGIPGSGKTTWANEFVHNNPDSIIIERDEIRQSFYNQGHTFSDHLENQVKQIQKQNVIDAIRDPRTKNIIVSDTNLNPNVRQSFYQIAQNFDVGYQEKVFHESFNRCVQRNENRGNDQVVPYDVMKRMYEKKVYQYSLQHQHSSGKENAYIFDIDGTLADYMGQRNIFDYWSAGNDACNEEIAEVARALSNAGYMILVLSGREAYGREVTEDWFQRHNIPYHQIWFRGNEDYRKDFVVKYDLFFEHIDPYYNVLGVFDDRRQVVDQWRRMGVRCFHVAEGNY